jgi:hypothetical protein
LAEKGRYVDAKEREDLAKQARAAFEDGMPAFLCGD